MRHSLLLGACIHEGIHEVISEVVVCAHASDLAGRSIERVPGAWRHHILVKLEPVVMSTHSSAMAFGLHWTE